MRSNIPDEYYTAEFMSVSRYGELTVAASLLTQEQHTAMRIQLASDFPNVINEIDALVAKIATKVSCFPPEELLQRAWWEYVSVAIKFGTDQIDDIEISLANRMIDYVQSIIVSVEPSNKTANYLSEDDWLSLKEDVHNLFFQLTLKYQICKMADLLLKDPKADMELEMFRFRSETLWLHVRGKRYQSHEIQALIEVLVPHTDILKKLFDIDAMLLVKELAKILKKLTSGIDSLFKELIPLQEEVLNRYKKISEKTGISNFNELLEKIYEDQNLATQMNAIIGELIGIDFFDVEKITCLPR